MPSGQHPPSKKPLLIPIAALLAILPMILHGGSCGHDGVFHIQGWFDAAAQLRHLHYPRWSFTSAWNAGEPRFLFYPPLSWLLGAILTLIFPPQIAVYAFIILTLTLAGLTMYRLAAHFTSPSAALIAAALYLANPYMLFNAFERSAFAELLAAAWIPLLLLAVLRHRPTIQGIAIPLALLWLTNAPAAVMASYTLALLATLRVIHVLALALRHQTTAPPSLSSILYPLSSVSLTLTYIAGTLLGLTLPAFFLVPAAYERRYIQVAMAVIPGMRIQDNFLFTHTADPGHNGVNLQVSLLALTLLILTVATTIILLVLMLRKSKSVILSEGARGFVRASQPKDLPPSQPPALSVAFLTATLVFLFIPISIPIWDHIPELAFLQFPWRLLTILSAILTFTTALLIHRARLTPPQTPHHPLRSTLYPLSSALLLGLVAFHLYAQFCQPTDRPAAVAELLRTHHGYAPTDEYTPLEADSDVLRTSNPGYWLIPSTANPNTPAPNTIPTPSELDPTLQSDDTPVPIAQTVSTTAPTHLTLHTTTPQHLIFNLRDYPAWDVTETGPSAVSLQHPTHIPRDDGLIEIPLDQPNTYTIDIHWHTTTDQQLGLALSACALLILLYLSLRTTKPTSNP